MTKGQQIRWAMKWTVIMIEQHLNTLTPEEYADMIIVGGPDEHPQYHKTAATH